MKATENLKDARAGKYLVFRLDNEEYGVDVLKIKEIVGMMPVTPMPQRRHYMKGVINLRGEVIPVVDLRLRLGMQEVEHTARTCVVVVEGQENDAPKCWEEKSCTKEECPAYGFHDHRCWMISGTYCRDEIQGTFHEKLDACRKCSFYIGMQDRRLVFTAGLVVDSVSDIANIAAEDIEDTPRFGGKLNTGYITGLAKVKGEVKILLDIDRVLNGH